MSTSDRMPYLTSTVLDQAFLNDCHDNLTNQLELAVSINAPTGNIHVSDRNKYVGSTFYQARIKFPVIKRALGEWLSGTLEFSTLDIELNNVDGIYNDILPGGADYDGWIGQSCTVSLGLRDVSTTYSPIFFGNVTPVAGFGRDTTAIKLTVRDKHETLNLPYPQTVFLRTDWPKIEDGFVGKGIPIIYGDWTTHINVKGASIPCFPVNGNDPKVNGAEIQVEISISSPAIFTASNHCFDNGDQVMTQSTGALPSPFGVGSTYYVVNRTTNTFQLATTPGGTPLNSSGSQSGTQTVHIPVTIQRPNVAFIIAENALKFIDTTNLYLRRGDIWYQVPAVKVTNVGLSNRYFEIIQEPPGSIGGHGSGDNYWVGGEPFFYSKGDNWFIQCKGKDISGGTGTYDGNAVAIAKDIMKTFGGMVDPDFSPAWGTYMDKAAPAQSAIKLIPARHWQQEQTTAITDALSLLNQVRLELFVNRGLLLDINPLHFEDWPAAPTFEVKNWDVEKDSFKPSVDVRNNFNRAQGVYNRLPDSGENTYQTAVFRNDTAIAQVGTIAQMSKTIVFPNLYIESDVANQVQEMIKLASSYLEVIDATITWRGMLLDIGQFVLLNVQIQSTVYENVPAMIRSVGYDPHGLKIPIQFWSLQMCPYPGYAPGYAGTVGGSSATITQES